MGLHKHISTQAGSAKVRSAFDQWRVTLHAVPQSVGHISAVGNGVLSGDIGHGIHRGSIGFGKGNIVFGAGHAISHGSDRSQIGYDRSNIGVRHLAIDTYWHRRTDYRPIKPHTLADSPYNLFIALGTDTRFVVRRDIRRVGRELCPLDLKRARQMHFGNWLMIVTSRRMAVTACHDAIHEVVTSGEQLLLFRCFRSVG